jgi:hypothetical protein
MEKILNYNNIAENERQRMEIEKVEKTDSEIEEVEEGSTNTLIQKEIAKIKRREKMKNKMAIDILFTIKLSRKIQDKQKTKGCVDVIEDVKQTEEIPIDTREGTDMSIENKEGIDIEVIEENQIGIDKEENARRELLQEEKVKEREKSILNRQKTQIEESETNN